MHSPDQTKKTNKFLVGVPGEFRKHITARGTMSADSVRKARRPHITYRLDKNNLVLKRRTEILLREES